MKVLEPIQTKETWHQYATCILSHNPSPYIDATLAYNVVLSEMVENALSMDDLKLRIKTFIAERQDFAEFAENHFDTAEYRKDVIKMLDMYDL